MKFKICWFQFHEFDTEEEAKEYLDYLPEGTRLTGYSEVEGGYEYECINTFEAKGIEEAERRIAKDSSGIEIFAVFNADTGERLFTEEDID
jgi:hypothetical protein